jgi:hypothetical protein
MKLTGILALHTAVLAALAADTCAFELNGVSAKALMAPQASYAAPVNVVPSTATEEVACGAIETPVPYKYCISRTIGSKNTDVLYYMHAGGENETAWSGGWRPEIVEVWEKAGVQSPIVIAVSFGQSWLLVEHNSLPDSGLLDIFRDSVMPQMELLALGRPASRRLLAGFSMGGLNAAQALMNLPPTTFARVGIACPAVLPLTPWAAQAEIDAFGKYAKTVQNLFMVAKRYVPDESYWNSKISPGMIAKTHMGKQTPPTLIIANEGDALFFEGGRLFGEAAVASGAPVTWQVWPGRHCEFGSAALAKFLYP